METLMARLQSLFSLQNTGKYLIDTFIPNILIFTITFSIFIIIWLFVKKTLSLIFKKVSVDKTIKSFIMTTLKYLLIIIGLITSLSQIGIDTGSILASLGVAGLTLGFAAKDALSNIISGIFIFWDRPFVIDDLIEIAGKYGTVTEITMRSTRILTVDGKILSIPNSQIVNSAVASYTNFPHLRLDIEFTVGPLVNIQDLRDLICSSLPENEVFLSEPGPQLILKSMNDYNLSLVFMVWIKDERKHIELRNLLTEHIYNMMLKNNIDLPYETINVNINGRGPKD